MARHLSKPCDARPHLMPVGIFFEKVREFLVMHERVWARSNKRHLTFKDVENLWQFIKAGASQDAAGVCNAIVAFNSLANFAAVFHDMHGAELEDVEDLQITAAAALPEDGRARTFKLDR